MKIFANTCTTQRRIAIGEKKKIKNKKKGQLGVNNMGKGGRARGKKKKMDI